LTSRRRDDGVSLFSAFFRVSQSLCDRLAEAQVLCSGSPVIDEDPLSFASSSCRSVQTRVVCLKPAWHLHGERETLRVGSGSGFGFRD